MAALARHIHHILSNGGDETQLICDVSENETWSLVAGSDIVAAVRVAAKALDLQSKGTILTSLDDPIPYEQGVLWHSNSWATVIPPSKSSGDGNPTPGKCTSIARSQNFIRGSLKR